MLLEQRVLAVNRRRLLVTGQSVDTYLERVVSKQSTGAKGPTHRNPKTPTRGAPPRVAAVDASPRRPGGFPPERSDRLHGQPALVRRVQRRAPLSPEPAIDRAIFASRGSRWHSSPSSPKSNGACPPTWPDAPDDEPSSPPGPDRGGSSPPGARPARQPPGSSGTLQNRPGCTIAPRPRPWKGRPSRIETAPAGLVKCGRTRQVRPRRGLATTARSGAIDCCWIHMAGALERSTG